MSKVADIIAYTMIGLGIIFAVGIGIAAVAYIVTMLAVPLMMVSAVHRADQNLNEKKFEKF